ncbi:hypothetical protein M8818_001130 [Zalaria obscura]|uniref:Uncharacterized protein n=1 Tax=Zalaria obscura TaxID=2024903 RepID=A0ACC3SLP2_9PEZI
MPYNNTPIAPSAEITGTVSLPLARVKKIIHADEDISNCSNNAAFVITVAAEMFLQYLVEQTHNVVKSERKPRRNIQYKDVANAVARIDNLEFLTDVVPRTVTYKAHKEKKAKEASHHTNGSRPQEADEKLSFEAPQPAVYHGHDPMEVDPTEGPSPVAEPSDTVTRVPLHTNPTNGI